jgi:uncharacterized membrane protein SirB2
MQSVERANTSRFLAVILLPLIAFRNAFASTPELNLMLSRRGIMPVIIGATLLVIGAVIIIVVLAVSGQIQSQFSCAAGDTACQNARNLLNVVPIVAGAVLVLSGVFMMIPAFRRG